MSRPMNVMEFEQELRADLAPNGSTKSLDLRDDYLLVTMVTNDRYKIAEKPNSTGVFLVETLSNRRNFPIVEVTDSIDFIRKWENNDIDSTFGESKVTVKESFKIPGTDIIVEAGQVLEIVTSKTEDRTQTLDDLSPRALDFFMTGAIAKVSDDMISNYFDDIATELGYDPKRAWDDDSIRLKIRELIEERHIHKAMEMLASDTGPTLFNSFFESLSGVVRKQLSPKETRAYLTKLGKHFSNTANKF